MKDKKLIPKDKNIKGSDVLIINIADVHSSQPINGKTTSSSYTVCLTITICIQPKLVARMSTPDYGCHTWGNMTMCIQSFFIDTSPDNNTGTGGGGGGTSTYSWWVPPSDPSCSQSQDTNVDFCEDTPGWTALEIPELKASYLKEQLALDQDQYNWLIQNSERADQIINYLSYSSSSQKVSRSKFHIDKMRFDAPYLNYVQQHGQSTANSIMWWDHDAFLQPNGGSGFGDWAINYLSLNPTLPFSTFSNWFFSVPEYKGGEDLIDPDQITYEEQVFQSPLPSLSSFTTNFPKLGTSGNYTQMPPSQVYELAGSTLHSNHLSRNRNYQDACAIRGSRALLYSGITIPVLKYGNSQRTEKGSDNKNYILDAKSFNRFMIDKFGETSHKLEGADANNPQKVADLLKGKNGIYVIINNDGSTSGAGYSGHVDLILNGACIGGSYTQPEGGVKSIRIWVLN